MAKLKPISTLISVLIISLAVGYALAAWQEPEQIPPEGNVSAPINVGPETQEKEGSIAASGFLGLAPSYGFYPDPGGASKTGSSLEITGPSSYLKLPLLTTAQRDALSSATGMMIYNATANEVQVYMAPEWKKLASGVPVGNVCTEPGDCVGGICYRDEDGDFYEAVEGTKYCQAVASLGIDCNDTNVSVYPGTACTTCDICQTDGNCVYVAVGTDPLNQCTEGWNVCISQCVRGGSDGYCDGFGACNITGATENISSGYVCTGSGAKTAVSSSNYCNYDEDCDAGDCSATKWYTSCNGTGACRVATDHTNAASVAVYASTGYTLTSTCGTTGTTICSYGSYSCNNICQLIRDSYRCNASHNCAYSVGTSTSDCSSATYCSGGSCVSGLCGADCYGCSGGSCVAMTTSCGAGLYNCTGATKRCLVDAGIGYCVTRQANGAACPSDDACCSNICGTDADNDGYFSQAAGHSGTCQATSKPYTDCCDSDANAKPGQTTYYTSANACGSFDYNCNGQEDQQYTVDCVHTLPAVGCYSSVISGHPGYTAASYACGATVTKRTCRGYGGDNCTLANCWYFTSCTDNCGYYYDCTGDGQGPSWKVEDSSGLWPCRQVRCINAGYRSGCEKMVSSLFSGSPYPKDRKILKIQKVYA